MGKSVLMRASAVLLLIALVVLVFSYFYYHYSQDNALLGKEYHEETKKPLVSLLFGILGTVLFASSIISLVFGLLMKK